MLSQPQKTFKEIEALIRESSELVHFQEEIEKRLFQAGTPENRLAVLVFMLEARLEKMMEELQEFLSPLS